MVISRARVESEPYREHPRWDGNRICETVIELFRRKKLTVDCLLQPIVKIDERPWEAIKLAVRYG